MQKRYNIKLYIFTFIMLIIATLLFFYRIHLANEGYVVAKMSQHHLGINLISSIKKRFCWPSAYQSQLSSFI